MNTTTSQHKHNCDCHNHIDKYTEAIVQFAPNNIDLSEDAVENAVKEIVDEAFSNDNYEVKRFLLSCIDLTSLNTTDTEETIMSLTQKINTFDNEYPDLPNVAAICIYPCFASVARSTIEADNVAISCVSGGFPSAQTFPEIKIAETALALKDGASEIDVVLPVGKFLAGDYEGVVDELTEIRHVCVNRTLKVILEAGCLGGFENVWKASFLAMLAGADFIKTSTGKQYNALATPQTAYVMCNAIKQYNKLYGKMIGFKVAGGIKTTMDAVVYYTIVEKILDKQWLNKSLFRIGTSNLANVLLSDLIGKKIEAF